MNAPRGRRKTSTELILVNGLPWSGRVVTVGPSGKQLTKLPQAGWGDIPDIALFLVYPGTYNFNMMSDGAYRGHIRGMGASPTDVLIEYTSDNNLWIQDNGLWGTGNWVTVIENVYLGASARGLTSTNYANLIANKCRIDHWNSGRYDQGTINGHWSPARQNGDMQIRHSYLYSASSTVLCALNLSRVWLKRTESNRSLGTYDCGGSLAESDNVTAPTVGYGYTYGEFLITGV